MKSKDMQYYLKISVFVCLFIIGVGIIYLKSLFLVDNNILSLSSYDDLRILLLFIDGFSFLYSVMIIPALNFKKNKLIHFLKEWFVNVLIVIGVLLMLVFCKKVYDISKLESLSHYDEICLQNDAFIFLYLVFEIIILFSLLGKIFADNNSNKRLRYNKYDFKINLNIMKQYLLKNVKSKYESFVYPTFTIKYLVVREFNLVNVYAFIEQDSMNIDIWNVFLENYFEDFRIKIFQNEKISNLNSVCFYFILSVEAKNDLFEKYVGRDIHQEFRMFFLQVGIDIKNNTIYIPVQRSKLYIGMYKRMKKKILNIIKVLDCETYK